MWVVWSAISHSIPNIVMSPETRQHDKLKWLHELYIALHCNLSQHTANECSFLHNKATIPKLEHWGKSWDFRILPSWGKNWSVDTFCGKISQDSGHLVNFTLDIYSGKNEYNTANTFITISCYEGVLFIINLQTIYPGPNPGWLRWASEQRQQSGERARQPSTALPALGCLHSALAIIRLLKLLRTAANITSSIQHLESYIQHLAFSIQHPVSSIQHVISSIYYLTFSTFI